MGPTHAKRSSYDETHQKSNLEPHVEGEYKASSLPRGAKISGNEKKKGVLDRTGDTGE